MEYKLLLLYQNFNIKFIIVLLFVFLYISLNIHKDYHSLTSFLKKKPKISIFIPIYNRENYINKCIKSLQTQTFKDIEIIAVNDYSNDNTLNILTNLAKKDSRIRIVNNDKNHGLLYSRAMGILNSSGEYLMNLDSDDEINDDECLEYLYNKNKYLKADIITFGLLNKKNNLIYKCNFTNQIFQQPQMFNYIFNKYTDNVRDYLITNKLIKKDVFLKAYEFLKNSIYNWKWNYFEDDIWNILVHKYAKSELCLDRLVYIYNYNNKSLMNKRFGNIEFQNILYRHEIYKKIFSKKEEQKYLIAEYNFLFNRLKSKLNNILLINNSCINKQIRNIFEYFINNYNCSINTSNIINNFLKKIPIN